MQRKKHRRRIQGHLGLLKDLAEFIAIRDGDAAFAAAKKAGRLGIPCVLLEDGGIFDGGEEPFSLPAVMKK